MQLALALLLCLASCIDTSSVRCGDTLCPDGTVCARVTNADSVDVPVEDLCVDPDQLTACAGIDASAPCTLDGVAESGRCYDDVCLPGGCGNGRIDRIDGEVCDDGDLDDGDGCSATCKSDESCPNGVLDPSEQCDDGNPLAHDGCTPKCVVEVPRWRRADVGRPAARAGHAMAFATRRGLTLMFGGDVLVASNGSTETVGDTWEWDGQGWIDRAPVFAPSPRTSAAMAYDARRDRVVLFGGRLKPDIGNTTTFDETWEWDGAQWDVAQPIIRPVARAYAGMAYDTKRDVMVLHGGRGVDGISGNTSLSDTWEWDGTTWSEKVSSPGPGPQGQPAMAFDPKRGVVVLVGLDATETSLVVWEYDGQWTKKSPSAVPRARRGSTLTFDPTSQRLLLVGGVALTAEKLGDTWAWDGTAWAELTAANIGPREAHAAVADTARKTIVVFGGEEIGVPTKFSDETYGWVASDTLWRVLESRAPSSRSGHAVAHDTRRARTVMFGGDNQDLFDTWEHAGTWSLNKDQSIPQRSLPAMAYDVARAKVVVFGGEIGTGETSDTRTFDGRNWNAIMTSPEPAARKGAAMVYDAARGEIVLFGGVRKTITTTIHNDTWIWNGTAWSSRSPGTVPPARFGHALAYDPIRERVVMFGGANLVSPLADTWEWDGVNWTPRITVTQPLARADAAITWSPARRRVVLFGGGPDGVAAAFNDAWEFDGATWSRLGVDQAPSLRRRAVMAPTSDGRGVFVFGGADRDGVPLGDLWNLTWEAPETSKETCTGEFDGDDDDLFGCADPSCWAVCTPTCSPGVTCAAGEPSCGNGGCDPLETCRSCASDCGPCTPLCGDLLCDPGETCPGDCP